MPDSTLNHTPAGWPYLDLDNYLDVIDDYSLELATKLESSDADVAAAINAATRAEAAAATAVAAAGRFAAGRFMVTGITANTNVFANVTFPAGRFTSAPVVVLTPETGNPPVVFASLNNVTAAGFTIRAYRTDTTTTLPVNWIAVQL